MSIRLIMISLLTALIIPVSGWAAYTVECPMTLRCKYSGLPNTSAVKCPDMPKPFKQTDSTVVTGIKKGEYIFSLKLVHYEHSADAFLGLCTYRYKSLGIDMNNPHHVWVVPVISRGSGWKNVIKGPDGKIKKAECPSLTNCKFKVLNK